MLVNIVKFIIFYRTAKIYEYTVHGTLSFDKTYLSSEYAVTVLYERTYLVPESLHFTSPSWLTETPASLQIQRTPSPSSRIWSPAPPRSRGRSFVSWRRKLGCRRARRSPGRRRYYEHHVRDQLLGPLGAPGQPPPLFRPTLRTLQTSPRARTMFSVKTPVIVTGL